MSKTSKTNGLSPALKRAIVQAHLRNIGQVGGKHSAAKQQPQHFTPETAFRAAQARWRNQRQQAGLAKSKDLSKQAMRQEWARMVARRDKVGGQ